MNCDDVLSSVEARSWNTLSTDARALAANHLDLCSSCRAAIEDHRRFVEVFRCLDSPPVPPRLATSTIEACRSVLAERESGSGSARLCRSIGLVELARRCRFVALFLAACVCTLCLFFSVWRGARSRVSPAASVPASSSEHVSGEASGVELILERSYPTKEPRVPRDQGETESFALAVSPDGTRVGVGDEEGRVRHVDLETGAEWVTPEWKGRVEGLMFSPDGSWLLAWNWEMAAITRQRLFGPSLLNLKESSRTPYESFRAAVGCPTSGQFIDLLTDRTFEMWDLETGRLTRTWRYDRSMLGLLELAASANGHFLLTVSDWDTRVWDLRQKEIKWRLLGDPGRATISPDGSLSIVQTGNVANVYRTDTASRLRSIGLGAHWFRSVQCLTNDLLGTIREKEGVQLWDLLDGGLVGSILPPDSADPLVSMAMTPDSRSLLVVSSRGVIHRYSMRRKGGSAVPTTGSEPPEATQAAPAPPRTTVDGRYDVSLRTLAEKIEKSPTTEETFHQRWYLLYNWVKFSRRSGRNTDFSESELVSVRICFYRDEHEACSQLDRMIRSVLVCLQTR